MFLEIISFFTINYIVFFSLFGFGLIILKDPKKYDIFLIFLLGYFTVGLLSLLYNFFSPINVSFSLIVTLIGFIYFILFLFQSKKKIDFSKLIYLHFILSLFLILKTEHAIDTNMYHHPFVSVLNSEKIIFGLNNIQFRFGHISFLQYVQAAYSNQYFNYYNLASINIAFYTVFIYLCLEKIFSYKKLDFYYFFIVSITIFLLVKYARYREFGNDLSALILSFYLIILILENLIFSKKESHIFILLPFLILMIFIHKISYVFVGLTALILTQKILKKLEKQKFLIFFFIFVTSIWSMKNIIHTSCLVYPIEISCIKNTEWYPKGLSDPKNAGFLTEIWSKDFINHPDWKKDRSLNLEKYINNYNWVSTWLKNHFIKILEYLSPLFVLMLILFSLNLNKGIKKNLFKKNIIKKEYSKIFLLNLIGLFIWFSNAPVFRYGASYIIIFFTFVSFFLLFKFSFTFSNLKNLKFFKYLTIVGIAFFCLKNIYRINYSNYPLLPETFLNENRTEIIHKFMVRPKPGVGVCYYTGKVCSHEIPESLNIIKKNGYYFIKG